MLIALILLATAAGAVLLAGWVWYPRRMARRGAVAVPVGGRSDSVADVSVVLATREDSAAIERRVENLIALDYPRDRLEIVVALDGSRAADRDAVAARLGSRAHVVAAMTPGKASALNVGVRTARNSLLFFVDTAQTFAPDVLRHLVSVLGDMRWGAVTATLAPTSGDALMDRYWQRELAIRRGQTDRHSVICVTGCAYVLRREFWREMPPGLICDDLWSTYSVVTQGSRVAIAPDAAVTDPRRFTRDQEYARRLRTMTGMLQFVRWFPAVRSPGRNPLFWDFLLHKLVRPATPFLLLIMALSLLGAVAMFSWRMAGIALAIGMGLALLPWALAAAGPAPLRPRIQTLVFAQRLVLMPLRAFHMAVRNDWDVWKPHR